MTYIPTCLSPKREIFTRAFYLLFPPSAKEGREEGRRGGRKKKKASLLNVIIFASRKTCQNIFP